MTMRFTLSRTKRRVVIIAALLVGTFSVAWAMQARLEADRKGEWVSVTRDDLVLGVDVVGTLAAVETVSIGPPQVGDRWDFKISMMAPEGSEVTQGRPVLGFDTSELQRQLEEVVAERDGAEKEIEKKRADLALKSEEEKMLLAEAESRLRKATVKLQAPDELLGVNERKTIELENRIAKRETDDLRERMVALKRAAEAELLLLESKRGRAAERVGKIEAEIASMTVRAPRNGTVIYATNWRGEKKKVGDSCWRAERVMEIPDLSTMMGKGEVDEVDAGKMALGQKVKLRLDSQPDEELSGTITSIARTIQPQSPRSQLKVLKVDIELAQSDPGKMRPGMRFRGTIELQRVGGATLVPREAVYVSASGPVAHRRGLLSAGPVAVKIGRRNEKWLEVIDGLVPGDRVLVRKSGGGSGGPKV
ncbi:MAG TPA: efflux RND transporter periplasmic adaptor subunit [Thermoanaerobaculia bacterium]|nr:efflux RND transporter periplasmic adaptor subunit [Thermoanaerobaculia bacterium]